MFLTWTMFSIGPFPLPSLIYWPILPPRAPLTVTQISNDASRSRNKLYGALRDTHTHTFFPSLSNTKQAILSLVADKTLSSARLLWALFPLCLIDLGLLSHLQWQSCQFIKNSPTLDIWLPSISDEIPYPPHLACLEQGLWGQVSKDPPSFCSFYLFCVLFDLQAAPCSMWDLVAQSGIKPCLLPSECGVLTTGQPCKSQGSPQPWYLLFVIFHPWAPSSAHQL